MPKNYRFIGSAYGILRSMKGGNKAHGFTLVETLVVVAITGVLFTAIVITLSGRQSRTEFTQSVQEIQSQIQQVVNDSAVGYYPNTQNFTCTASVTGPTFSTFATTSQGANAGCVFLGKAIQFGVSGAVGGIEKVNIFTIAGLQRTAAGDEIQTYDDAKATPIAMATASVNGTENKKLLYGLTVGKMYYGATKTPIGTVAFVNSLASYSASGNLDSGSQQIQVVPIKNSQLNNNEATAANDIKSQLASSDFNPDTGVTICFVSGGTDQTGYIKIGGGGRQLSVTLEIKGTKVCS